MPSIRTMLGRVIRDFTRKIVRRPELADVFEKTKRPNPLRVVHVRHKR
jgi:hypothetical protein